MSKPRITIVRSSGKNKSTPSVQIYVNPLGRDLLVQQLSSLDDTNEHFHLWPEDWDVEVPLQSIVYDSASEVIVDNAKILFRLDEWDTQFFPHVMLDNDGD